MQKGDGDAATWLPPNKAYRCAYVARQVAVKVSYGLWMTQAEKNAIATVLSSCPNEPLPGGVVANVPVPVAAAGPGARPPQARAGAPKPVPPRRSPHPPRPGARPGAAHRAGGVYYANCTAGRAAGAAPVHRATPATAAKLDRDGDGIGCENRP